MKASEIRSLPGGKRDIAAIYKITNRRTGRFYIGVSRSIRARWLSHISGLLTGKHHRRLMLEDLALGSIEDFDFEIVESIPNPVYGYRREAELIMALRPAYNGNPKPVESAFVFVPRSRFRDLPIQNRSAANTFVSFRRPVLSQTITFSLSETKHRILKNRAKQSGRTMNGIIRDALDAYFEGKTSG